MSTYHVSENFQPLTGIEVRLWRPCHCGAPTCVIETSSGLARLECARCANYRGWLSAEACRFISTIIAEFGKLDSPIIVNPKQKVGEEQDA